MEERRKHPTPPELLFERKNNEPVGQRKKKIDRLKVMINNEAYVKEAISKLANSLTSGLMQQ